MSNVAGLQGIAITTTVAAAAAHHGIVVDGGHAEFGAVQDHLRHTKGGDGGSELGRDARERCRGSTRILVLARPVGQAYTLDPLRRLDLALYRDQAGYDIHTYHPLYSLFHQFDRDHECYHPVRIPKDPHPPS